MSAQEGNSRPGGIEESMAKDHLERRTYRKSPGRQYGYDYDPLRSQGGQSRSGGSQQGETMSKSGALLAQRPDPRRTRQLMRQSIIASKRPNDEETEAVDLLTDEQYPQRYPSQELDAEDDGYDGYNEDTEDISERVPSRSGRRYVPRGAGAEEYLAVPVARRQESRAGRFDEPALPHTSELLPDEEEYIDDTYNQYNPNDWRPLDVGQVVEIDEPGRSRNHTTEYDDHDHFIDDDDDFADDAPVRSPQRPPARSRRAKPTRELPPEREYPAEEEGYEYEYEEENPSVRPSRKRKKLTRRGLLLAAGVAAVAGVGVAAYEVVPKVPGVVNSATTNVEHQIQEAFNKGMEQGAEQARKEIVTALDNLEGFTLDGAIAAARLTRVAYDVFVSPVVKTGSALTGDFLNGMLKAFRTARQWLASVNQDNASLIAIQKVLEAWSSQVSTLPKQLDAITQTDLDGAQAYLRALQRKVEDEKSKLNKQDQQGKQTTPAAPTQSAQAPNK